MAKIPHAGEQLGEIRFRTFVRNLEYKPYVKTLSIRKYNLLYKLCMVTF